MVIRMRHNRSQTKQRRSHHGLTAPTLSTCTNCQELHRPHHMCLNCGFYKGRQVMDLAAEKAKREARLKAKRERISAEVGLPDASAPTAPAPENDEAKPDRAQAREAKGKASARKREESAPHTTKDEI